MWQLRGLGAEALGHPRLRAPEDSRIGRHGILLIVKLVVKVWGLSSFFTARCYCSPVTGACSYHSRQRPTSKWLVREHQNQNNA